jgi:hypothetical protein
MTSLVVVEEEAVLVVVFAVVLPDDPLRPGRAHVEHCVEFTSTL